ncbi:MAG: response regulator, partial [Usitatibacter sp.]
MIDPGPAVALRVLLIEDSEDDAVQVLRQLKKGGYAVTHLRIETEAAMRAALDDATWDLVICDYRMPRFTGLAALGVLRERNADLPFIVVSGTIGEETAVAMMKAGASDYVMKGNLTHLAAAVRRELRDAETRIERRQARTALRESEQRFRQLAETIGDAFFIQDV